MAKRLAPMNATTTAAAAVISFRVFSTIAPVPARFHVYQSATIDIANTNVATT